MNTIQDKKDKIATLEKNLNNRLIDDRQKQQMREGIKKLEKEITALEKQAQQEEAQQAKEKEAEAVRLVEEKRRAKEEKQAQEAQDKQERLQQEAEAQQKAKAQKEAAEKKEAERLSAEARKKKGKVSEANRSDCEKLIADIRRELSEFTAQNNPKKTKARRKKSSASVASGIIKPIQTIAKREMSQEKVVKIKTDELREARQHFEKGLQKIKLAFGGIQDSNSTILKDFRKQMDTLIKEIEDKQKSLQPPAKKAS